MPKQRERGLGGLPIHRREGYWICYIRTPSGQRKQRALHIRDDGSTASERAAVAAYWQEQARATAGINDRPRATKTLGKALDALRAAKELAEASEHTLDVVLFRGVRLLEHFGPDYDMQQITSQEPLVQYATQARATRSGRTVTMELNILLQAMRAVGLPTPPKPRIKADPKPQEPLTEEEQRRVLLAVTPTHRLTLLAYLTLGLRLSEIRKIDDIDWEGQTLWIRGTKTARSTRQVPIPDELFELMCALRRAGTWSGFTTISNPALDRVIRRACRRAGIGPRSANDLRGTVSQRLRRAGVDPETRGAFQGNSAKMQEQTYTQAHTMLDVMRDAVQKTKRITKKGDTGS